MVAGNKKSMGMWHATSIGLGAMIGAGIFVLIGIGVDLAGPYTYISFLIGGGIALTTAYSVSKLAVVYPTKGGTVKYINVAYPNNIFNGTINVMTWIGYIVVTSLYARAFGEYTLALFGSEGNTLWLHLLGSAVLVVFVFINFLGAGAVGKAGLITALTQTAILVAFGITGLTTMKTSMLVSSDGMDIFQVLLVSGLVFMSYQGFALVANTAEDLRNAEKNLPRALILSVFVVMSVYLLVNIAVVGNLSVEKILEAKEYVLAKAAQPILGSIGFTILGVAAMFSTSSAINSTIYGPVYIIQEAAKSNQAPKLLTRALFGHPSGYALISTGFLVLAITNTFNLQSIAEMGSMIFLVAYTAVNYANFKLFKITKSKRWITVVAMAGTLTSLAALIIYLWQKSSLSLITFVGVAIACLVFEWLYQTRIATKVGTN